MYDRIRETIGRGVYFGRRPFCSMLSGRTPLAPFKKDGPVRQRRYDDFSEPFFKVRQILILAALILGFAFAVRLASGDPLPHDLRNLVWGWLGMKHSSATTLR